MPLRMGHWLGRGARPVKSRGHAAALDGQGAPAPLPIKDGNWAVAPGADIAQSSQRSPGYEPATGCGPRPPGITRVRTDWSGDLS